MNPSGSISSSPVLGRRFSMESKEIFQGSSVAEEAKRRFEEKLRQGTYLFESRACFCGSPDSVLLADRDRYGLHYPLVLCERCGLIRAQPRLTAESYREFYDAEFRPLYGDDEGDIDEKFERWREEGEEVFRYIHSSASFSPGVVLDVGCHTGAMLVPFLKTGWDVYGVDYGSHHLEYGRIKTGIETLLHGGIDRFLALGKKADLIILNHVFEHLIDLDEEVRKIRSALKEGGHVFISVPGTYWWIRHRCGGNIKYLLQNAHTYQFGLKILSYVFECGGFSLVRGDERVYSLFQLSPDFRLKKDVPLAESKKVLQFLLRTERTYLPRWWVGVILERLGLKKIVNRWRS